MKENKKRIIAMFLVFILLALVGCKKKEAADTAANATNTTSAVDSQASNKTESETQTIDETEVYVPTVSAILYGAGADNLQWEISDSVLRAMLGLYQTSGINYIAVLGGTNEWPEGYLSDLLNTNDSETVNRTGWFCVNVDAVNEKLNAIAEEFDMDPWDIGEVISSGEQDEFYEELLDRLNQEMFCEATLPQIEGTEISLEYPIQDKRTLVRTLNIVVDQFPADDYFMTMSGHGTGSIGGICYPQKYVDGKDDCLTIPAMEEAFYQAGFGDDLKLDLLSFDACGMGGIELGAYLGNYYTYMIGSQMSQWGGLDQYVLVRSIENNRTDEYLGYYVASDVHEKKYNDSKNGMPLQTGAIFFGPNGAYALYTMDTAAAALLDAAGKDAETEAEIYDALKKAMMYSRNNDNYPDGRDLFNNLLTALHEKNLTQFDEVIEGAISGINEFMVENWYSFDNMPMYNSLEGGIIQENAEYREKYMNHELCGGNVISIDYSKYLEAYTSDSAEEFNERVADIIKDYDVNYFKRYKDHGLENYATLMKSCAEYYLREDKYVDNKTLAKDLVDPAGADYQEITDVHWSDDKKVVQVEIEDYKDEEAEASSGDVLTDFLDTASSYKLYLTRKLPIEKKSNGKQIELDYIIGSNVGERQSLEATNREINFRVSELMTVPIYYVSSPSAKKDTSLNIAIPSSQYEDFWYKVEVLKTALSVDEDAAINSSDQYSIYEGRCKTKGKVSNKPALHVFKKDGDNYKYTSTVLVEDDWYYGEYSLVKDPEAINFDHYYMGDVISDENGKDTGTDSYKCIEKEYTSVYDKDVYWYSKDVLNRLAINKIEASALDNDPQKYGYFIGVVPTSAVNSTVLFNKNDDAVRGKDYAELPVYGDIE